MIRNSDLIFPADDADDDSPPVLRRAHKCVICAAETTSTIFNYDRTRRYAPCCATH
jgi:hypothetical protein